MISQSETVASLICTVGKYHRDIRQLLPVYIFQVSALSILLEPGRIRGRPRMLMKGICQY